MSLFPGEENELFAAYQEFMNDAKFYILPNEPDPEAFLKIHCAMTRREFSDCMDRLHRQPLRFIHFKSILKRGFQPYPQN